MKCQLCNKIGEQKYLESHTDSGIEYKLYECVNCHAQYWLPLKNPGAAWYEHDTRYAGANKNPPLEPNWNHKKVISFLFPFKGNVLDVGCGTGNFLAHAYKQGWNVAGIDFDRNAIRAAHDVFGLKNTEVNDLKTYYDKHKASHQPPFDLVTFFDVFEHIDNHGEFLSLIKNMLTPNGFISMSMPYRYGSRWLQPNDLPPRHLTRWDRSSLTRYLENNGFKVKYIRRGAAPFFFIVMKLRFKYGKYFSFGLVKKAQENNKEKIQSHAPAALISTNKSKKSFKVTAIHALAKTKDIVIFGIPAAIIWFGFLFTRKRYTDLFAIAQKVSN